GFAHCLTIGSGYVDQYAIDIEDDYIGGCHLPDILEFLQEFFYLFMCADGDAYTSRKFIAAIADKNIAIAQFVANLDGAVASLEQYKIGLAHIIRNAQTLKADIEEFSRGQYFR